MDHIIDSQLGGADDINNMKSGVAQNANWKNEEVSDDTTHVLSENTKVHVNPEVKSSSQVKASNVTDLWDDYLGPNQTNINPRTGEVDNDRIFSADGTRSIRFGDHEMKSMETTKFHFHEEQWVYDETSDVLEYYNTLYRIK